MVATLNLIHLLILLMAICNGCRKELKNDHGLKRHRTSCRLAKAHSAALLHQRQLLQRSTKKLGIGKRDDVEFTVSEPADNVSYCRCILPYKS